MSDPIAAIPLATRLPADAYYHLIRTLRLTLPPPPDAGPEALAKRDHAAVARVAALAPADAAEAELAAQFVAASEQWTDCLRLAHASGTTPEWAAKCRAQGLAMMRQANAALSLLLRLQGARARLDNAAADRRAWIEHTATRLMTEALAEPPAPNSLSRPAGEGPAAPPTPDSLSRAAGEGRGEGPGGEAGGTASGEPGEAIGENPVSNSAPTAKIQKTIRCIGEPENETAASGNEPGPPLPAGAPIAVPAM